MTDRLLPEGEEGLLIGEREQLAEFIRGLIREDVTEQVAQAISQTPERQTTQSPQSATPVSSEGTTSEEPADTAPAAPTDPVAVAQAENPPGPVQFGTVVLPQGAELVRVNNPRGSDEPYEYFLVYSIHGTRVAYRVGGQSRMDELFPAGGLATFDSFRTVTDDQFGELAFTVGEVDEILGSTESLQSVFERELRAQGLESLPNWIINSPDAMGILVVASQEGWSEGRTWKALQGTDAFNARFPGMAQFMGRNQLEDVRSAVTAYVNSERELGNVLRRYRGPDTNINPDYLGGLIGEGWTPTEAASVLEGESLIRRNPEALQQFQQLMAAQGQQVGVEDFLDVFRGQAQPDVLEVLNDTFRFQALAEAGLDVDATFAQFLGSGASLSLTPNGFTDAAQSAAQAILQFGLEIDANKFGITREDVISAAFDQESPGGRSAAEISDLIGRFGRDRANRARGLAGFQAFLNNQGRITVAGVGE